MFIQCFSYIFYVVQVQQYKFIKLTYFIFQKQNEGPPKLLITQENAYFGSSRETTGLHAWENNERDSGFLKSRCNMKRLVSRILDFYSDPVTY